MNKEKKEELVLYNPSYIFNDIPIESLDNNIIANAYAEAINKTVYYNFILQKDKQRIDYFIEIEKYVISFLGSIGLAFMAKYLTTLLLRPIIFILTLFGSSPFYLLDLLIHSYNLIIRYYNKNLVYENYYGLEMKEILKTDLEKIGNTTPILFIFLVSFIGLFLIMRLMNKANKLKEVSTFGLYLKFE